MLKSSIAFIAAVAGSAGLISNTAENAAIDPDLPLSCYIDVAETDDGLQLTAWGLGLDNASYRMVVTQRMGGGGFDIVQEGEIPAPELETEEDAFILSDMLIATDAEFSAELMTWNTQGDQICRWGERV